MPMIGTSFALYFAIRVNLSILFIPGVLQNIWGVRHKQARETILKDIGNGRWQKNSLSAG